MYFTDKPKRSGLNFSTGKLTIGNIARSKVNHHLVFVKFPGGKNGNKENRFKDKELKSCERIITKRGTGRVDVIGCLVMAPDYINRTRRNGAGFNPLRIICTGLTFSMGLIYAADLGFTRQLFPGYHRRTFYFSRVSVFI